MAPAKNTTDRAKSRIWLWVVVAFIVQVAAWVGLFMLAAHHPVDEVPLHRDSSVTSQAPLPTAPRPAR